MGRTRTFKTAVLIGALFHLTACVSLEPVQRVESFDLIDRHHRKEILLIDVRPQKEIHERGTVRDAVSIPLGNSPEDHRAFAEQARKLWEIDRRPIALICRVGLVAERAASTLVENGIAPVIVVSDGYEGSGNGPGWMSWSRD